MEAITYECAVIEKKFEDCKGWARFCRRVTAVGGSGAQFSSRVQRRWGACPDPTVSRLNVIIFTKTECYYADVKEENAASGQAKYLVSGCDRKRKTRWSRLGQRSRQVVSLNLGGVFAGVRMVIPTNLEQTYRRKYHSVVPTGASIRPRPTLKRDWANRPNLKGNHLVAKPTIFLTKPCIGRDFLRNEEPTKRRVDTSRALNILEWITPGRISGVRISVLCTKIVAAFESDPPE